MTITSSPPSSSAPLPKQTYCTNCKTNVDISDGRYVRLANRRAVIEGKCTICGMGLIKAKVMPKSAAVFKKRKRKAGLLKK